MNSAIIFLLAIRGAACGVDEMSSGPDGFRPGAVCDSVTPGTDASKMLRGKHLRILDLVWMPFAIQDENAPRGWSGYDIDLLNAVADKLEITYEVVDMGYPGEGETWTEHLINVCIRVSNPIASLSPFKLPRTRPSLWQWINRGDLVACWWGPNSVRYDKVVSASFRHDRGTSWLWD